MEVSNPWRFIQVLMSLDFTMDTDLHPSCFRLYFVLHFPVTSVCYREIIYGVLKTTQFSSAYYALVRITKLSLDKTGTTCRRNTTNHLHKVLFRFECVHGVLE